MRCRSSVFVFQQETGDRRQETGDRRQETGGRGRDRSHGSLICMDESFRTRRVGDQSVLEDDMKDTHVTSESGVDQVQAGIFVMMIKDVIKTGSSETKNRFAPSFESIPSFVSRKSCH